MADPNRTAEKERQPNVEQQKVIDDTTSRLIAVTAKPGAGKTFTLARRLTERIARGGDPNRTVMVTFTNRARAAFERAAREDLTASGRTDIASRIVAPNDRRERRAWDPDPLWIETFHGACRRIVACHLPELGLRSMPRVVDGRELTTLAELALIASGDAPKEDRYRTQMARTMLDELGVAASQGVDPRSGEKSRETITPPKAFRQLGVEMAREGLWTIDDLTLHAYRLLNQDEAIRDAWAERFDEIAIDEYQDTDPLLSAIVGKLARHATIIAAGDEGQSIYGWRNAVESFSALRAFEPTHGATVHYELTKNYRATAIIEHSANLLRADSDPNGGPGAGPNGPPPWQIKCRTEEDALAAVDQWLRMMTTNQRKLGLPQRTAILTAERAEGRMLAAALRTRGHEVWVGRTLKNYEPLLAWQAWWTAIAADEPSLPMLAQAFSRGPERLRPTEIYNAMREHGRPGETAWGCLQRRAGGDRETPKSPLSTATERLQGLKIVAEENQPRVNTAELSLDELDEAGERTTTASAGTAVVFQELTRSLETIKSAGQLGDEAVEQWELWRATAMQTLERDPDITVRDIARMTEGQEQRAEEPPENAIEVHTMHSSKGLEWDAVCLWRWEEGHFPKVPEPEAEKQRVAHVAASRARRVITGITVTESTLGSPIMTSRYLLALKPRVAEYPDLLPTTN